MAEFIPPQPAAPDAHLPNVEATYIDLHRLLSIFLASKAFADRINAPAGHAQELQDPLFMLQACEEDEISRILLSVAITARVVDDARGRILDLVALTCGELIPDIQRPERGVQLELREACNKIIHAIDFRPVYDHVDRPVAGGGDAQVWHLDGQIELAGVQSKKDWEAVLNVQEFLEIVVDRLEFEPPESEAQNADGPG